MIQNEPILISRNRASLPVAKTYDYFSLLTMTKNLSGNQIKALFYFMATCDSRGWVHTSKPYKKEIQEATGISYNCIGAVLKGLVNEGLLKPMGGAVYSIVWCKSEIYNNL